MNEEIIEIIQQYKFEHIPEKQAVNELFGLFGVSYCATKIKNVLCNRFTNEAKKHVGKKIDEVPELAEMLKAIKIVEKHCS